MFCFPMAGLSARFTKAGYDRPKYYLDVGAGMNLFQASLKGFSRYFESDDFCFVYLTSYIDDTTIRAWAAEVGLPEARCHCVPLTVPTRGQADTVRQGVLALCDHQHLSPDEELVIFNIDTLYHDFRKPDAQGVGDGPRPMVNYLDVTRMPGTHWSFVDPDPAQAGRARRVVEKQRISDLCSVGLYQFCSVQLFLDLYHQRYGPGAGGSNPQATVSAPEAYVAPLYQTLIETGEPVPYRLLSQSRFGFLGTPQDYEAYLATALLPPCDGGVS